MFLLVGLMMAVVMVMMMMSELIYEVSQSISGDSSFGVLTACPCTKLAVVRLVIRRA